MAAEECRAGRFFNLAQFDRIRVMRINNYQSMEHAMSNSDNHQPNHHLVKTVLNSIADWVNKYRSAIDDSAMCKPQEVMKSASDLGLPASELHVLAGKGPNSLNLLRKMVTALGVDPLVNIDPLVMRELQRVCTNCLDQRRCEHELAKGTAAEHFHDFCPNAFTLESLVEQRD